jgi:hypothetical protein
VITDDPVILYAVRNGVIKSLASGLVHVNEDKAFGDDHLLRPSTFYGQEFGNPAAGLGAVHL